MADVELQTTINQTPMKEMVEYVNITTDPKRYIGAVLSEHGYADGFDPADWTFLTSAPGQLDDNW